MVALKKYMKINKKNMSLTQVTQIRSSYQSHPYHLTLESPWPILTSGAILSILSSAALWFNSLINSEIFLAIGVISTIFAMSLWFSDVTKEGTYLGTHTRVVQHCLSMGVSLFIVTETFFFVSIFWAFLHSALSPTVEIGGSWVPAGFEPLSALTLPLLNTVLLVSSGAAVTYAHHAMINKNRGPALFGLILTVIIAVLFTGFQAYEYVEAPFTIADGAYGSCFFFSTGFHGIHVIVGTIMIIVAMIRLVNYHFTESHHLGLESAILYWHFVDVVWLFLYVVVYYWSMT